MDLLHLTPDIEETPQTGAGWPTPALDDAEWLRLPGLFRCWELQQVVDSDHEFHIEAAGHHEDGTSLFAIYKRPHSAEEETK